MTETIRNKTTQIQFKRNIQENFNPSTCNEVLKAGEPFYDWKNNNLYIGTYNSAHTALLPIKDLIPIPIIAQPSIDPNITPGNLVCMGLEGTQLTDTVISTDNVVTTSNISNNVQKIKGAGTSFNSNATIDIVAGSNVSVSGNTSDNKITISATDTTYSNATTSSAGLMSSTDKTKLNNIAQGAEVNQNAYSSIVVGNTTISADSKTDFIELQAGTNVTLTALPEDKIIRINASGGGGEGVDGYSVYFCNQEITLETISIAKGTLSPSDATKPAKVGDSIIGSNGGLVQIMSNSSQSEYYSVAWRTSIKGEKGDTGNTGPSGQSIYYATTSETGETATIHFSSIKRPVGKNPIVGDLIIQSNGYVYWVNVVHNEPPIAYVEATYLADIMNYTQGTASAPERQHGRFVDIGTDEGALPYNNLYSINVFLDDDNSYRCGGIVTFSTKLKPDITWHEILPTCSQTFSLSSNSQDTTMYRLRSVYWGAPFDNILLLESCTSNTDWETVLDSWHIDYTVIHHYN